MAESERPKLKVGITLLWDWGIRERSRLGLLNIGVLDVDVASNLTVGLQGVRLGRKLANNNAEAVATSL